MRTVFISGANKGIGLATAQTLLKREHDCFVFLGSRSQKQGQHAKKYLVEINPSWENRLHVVTLDITNASSIDDAFNNVANNSPNTHAPLSALVHNAGVIDCFANVLDVNVFGTWALGERFWPLLAKKNARVVLVSSSAGPSFISTATPTLKAQLLSPNTTWPQLVKTMKEYNAQQPHAEAMQAYGFSKACVNTLMRIWTRKHPHIQINACTPGFIHTDMTQIFLEQSGQSPEAMGMKPPLKGAEVIHFLLTSHKPKTGQYYGSDCLRSPLSQYRAPGSPEYNGND